TTSSGDAVVAMSMSLKGNPISALRAAPPTTRASSPPLLRIARARARAGARSQPVSGSRTVALIGRCRAPAARFPYLLPVNPLIEVAQDARGDAPNVTVPVRNFIVVTDNAVPVAALAPVILRPHQVTQRNLEDVGHFRTVGLELKIRCYACHSRQN